MATQTETKQVGDPEVVKALSLVSQAWLARSIGKTAPYLSLVLAGRRMPRPEVLVAMARKLGVSMEQLYRHLTLTKQAREKMIEG